MSFREQPNQARSRLDASLEFRAWEEQGGELQVGKGVAGGGAARSTYDSNSGSLAASSDSFSPTVQASTLPSRLTRAQLYLQFPGSRYRLTTYHTCDRHQQLDRNLLVGLTVLHGFGTSGTERPFKPHAGQANGLGGLGPLHPIGIL